MQEEGVRVRQRRQVRTGLGRHQEVPLAHQLQLRLAHLPPESGPLARQALPSRGPGETRRIEAVQQSGARREVAHFEATARGAQQSRDRFRLRSRRRSGHHLGHGPMRHELHVFQPRVQRRSGWWSTGP